MELLYKKHWKTIATDGGKGKLSCDCPHMGEIRGGVWSLQCPVVPLFPACSDLYLEAPFSFDGCDGCVFHLTAVFAVVLLVVFVCACLLAKVAQFELLVSS